MCKALTDCSTDAGSDPVLLAVALGAAVDSGLSLQQLARETHDDPVVANFIERLAWAVDTLPERLLRVGVVSLEDTLGSGKSTIINQALEDFGDESSLLVASEWYDVCHVYGFDGGLALKLGTSQRETFILAMSVVDLAETLARKPQAKWVLQDRSLLSVVWQWGDNPTRAAFEWMFHRPPASLFALHKCHFVFASLPVDETRKAVRERGRMMGHLTEEEFYFREVDGRVFYDSTLEDMERFIKRLREENAHVHVCHSRHERQVLLKSLLSSLLPNEINGA